MYRSASKHTDARISGGQCLMPGVRHQMWNSGLSSATLTAAQAAHQKPWNAVRSKEEKLS